VLNKILSSYKLTTTLRNLRDSNLEYNDTNIKEIMNIMRDLGYDEETAKKVAEDFLTSQKENNEK
jgi:hypothetical protein